MLKPKFFDVSIPAGPLSTGTALRGSARSVSPPFPTPLPSQPDPPPKLSAGIPPREANVFDCRAGPFPDPPSNDFMDGDVVFPTTTGMAFTLASASEFFGETILKGTSFRAS